MRWIGLALLAGWSGAASAEAIWKGPVVKDWREVERLTLSGTMEADMFRPAAIAPEREAAPPVPLLAPMGVNLLPLADIRPFGIEERVTAERDGEGLRIRCRTGRAAAGLVLRWPDRRLPRGYRGQWRLEGRLEGRADTRIGVEILPVGQDASAAPAALRADGPSVLPLADQPGEQALVLICPGTDASAMLDAVILEPVPVNAPGGAGARSGEVARSGASDARGTWVWQERDWHGDPSGFARRAAEAGWTELAIQAPAMPDASLARLAAALAEWGIGFRLLDGDPAMATAEGRGGAARRFARLRRWCDDHLAARPLLELDIEPYALPGFAADPVAGWQGWAQTVQAVAGAWGGPVAVDVPWWMRRSSEGAAAIDSARAAIREIIVMAYRTDPQLVLDAAESWLAQDGPPVRIAIETGPVAREATRLYRRAPSGTLRLSDAGAELLAAPQAAGPSDAMFALVRESRTDSARISFHGAPARAVEAERMLAPLLSGWPGFAGFRVHGWEAPHG
ncbi:hypothetical protein Sphch_3417 [Sphingobium chlorophenolicum L-1]|uniref:Uncharacterized protein n=2 Tax=Sphingobium chlorophenolicum TaxID=46429 RepID=F6F3K0_SPHCR|nr:hypothetical protein Sphch_3417 [Sphingobium chlorophenolicum L-1]